MHTLAGTARRVGGLGERQIGAVRRVGGVGDTLVGALRLVGGVGKGRRYCATGMWCGMVLGRFRTGFEYSVVQSPLPLCVLLMIAA